MHIKYFVLFTLYAGLQVVLHFGTIPIYILENSFYGTPTFKSQNAKFINGFRKSQDGKILTAFGDLGGSQSNKFDRIINLTEHFKIFKLECS